MQHVFSLQSLVRGLQGWHFLLYSIALSRFFILSTLSLKGVVEAQGVKWLENSGGKVYSLTGFAIPWVSDQASQKFVCKGELATQALQYMTCRFFMEGYHFIDFISLEKTGSRISRKLRWLMAITLLNRNDT
jgi:hypothetical protein